VGPLANDPVTVETRCGFVGVVGRTNTGKSTLVNALAGQTVAVTSPHTQTTQLPVRAILTEGAVQAVFVDTPGLHRPRDAFGRELLRRVDLEGPHVDVLVAVVEPGDLAAGGTTYLLARLARWDKPTLLVINKVDLVPPRSDVVRRTADALGAAHPFSRIYPVSSVTGLGVEELKAELLARMPVGPHHYPADWVTDLPQTLYVAEIIRGWVMNLTREELPHDVQVEVDSLIETAAGGFEIKATIYCARESQKGILIGQGGRMIKRIGTEARAQLEAETERPVMLKTNVAVRPGWRKMQAPPL